MLSQAVNSWENSLLRSSLPPHDSLAPPPPSFHPPRTCGRWVPIAYANFPQASAQSVIRNAGSLHGTALKASDLAQNRKSKNISPLSLSLSLSLSFSLSRRPYRLSAEKKDDPEPMLRIMHSGTRAGVLLGTRPTDRPQIQIWRPSPKTSWRGYE